MPADNRIYDLKTGDQVDSSGRKVPEAVRYRLQISRSRLFVPDSTEVDLDDRVQTQARVKVSEEGSYFWRVAAIDAKALASDWSSVRRFKMMLEPREVGLGRRGAARAHRVSPPSRWGTCSSSTADGAGRDRDGQRRAGRRRAGRLVQEDHHGRARGRRRPSSSRRWTLPETRRWTGPRVRGVAMRTSRNRKT